MKNIYEILKSIGIEIPDGKKDTFDKDVVSNYKTIKEVEKIQEKVNSAVKAQEKLEADIKQRDEDLKSMKKQLEEAGEDTTKLAETRANLEKLQKDYNDQKSQYDKQLDDQRYEFAIKELCNNIKFSSNSAKKAFLGELMENRLTMKDNDVLGFNDFVDNYKKQDEGAFIVEDDSKTKEDKLRPKFSTKTNKLDETETKEDEPKERPLIW